jgi:uncharacterized membrane protein
MAASLSTSRLEAFSDGVIAVIITIMVLELKVPESHAIRDHEILRENFKILAIYLLSFINVGIYWVNHHYLTDDLETVSHGILWANLSLLFTLSLLPFGVEWVGSRGITPAAVTVYAVCFTLPSLSWAVLSRCICSRTGLRPASGALKQTASAVMSLLAIAVAHIVPWAALALLWAVALLWLFPPRQIREKARALKPSGMPPPHSS